MSLLNIDQVGVSYTNAQGQTTVALDQVSLQVPPGELLVILGPSGCGKTTLLNLVAGFAHPTSGRVELGGRTVSGPGADRGVIFQHDALLPWLTVIENVAKVCPRRCAWNMRATCWPKWGWPPSSTTACGSSPVA